MGPTVSRLFGEIGNTPLRGTRRKVVFKPKIPQQAAGTRTEPAVSVPSATSAIPAATATAEPLEEPPGINLRLPTKRFLGVPKYSFIPEPPNPNSVRLVLPTIQISPLRAPSRHSASARAGTPRRARCLDPAVVTTPLTSIRSLTARRSCWLPAGGGEYEIKARFLGPDSAGCFQQASQQDSYQERFGGGIAERLHCQTRFTASAGGKVESGVKSLKFIVILSPPTQPISRGVLLPAPDATCILDRLFEKGRVAV